MAKKPLPAPVVDLRREIATLRAGQAPVIFFELISSFGVRNGVANVTLEGGLHYILDRQNIDESHTVAHLRFPVAAIPTIRAALDSIENALKPVPENLKN
jgi:hypothetical protein